jgi:hypothetical protein
MGPVINRELRHLHQPSDLNVIPAQPFHQAAASTSVMLGVNLFHLLIVGKASLYNLDILGNAHAPLQAPD